jgi:hypothetical protein
MNISLRNKTPVTSVTERYFWEMGLFCGHALIRSNGALNDQGS